MAKIDPFAAAKAKSSSASSSKKDNKEVVFVSGLEEKLLEYEFLKAQITDLQAQYGAVESEIKQISKEEFVKLYETKKSNPNTFLIKDGKGCVMVMPSDRYISIKEEERANELMEKYGKDSVTVDELISFNTQVLQRNYDTIMKLIANSKNISDEDKMNLFDIKTTYSIKKGLIDRLLTIDEDIDTIVDDIQPVIALKVCGEKMADGGTMGTDIIGFVYE